jgi:hypothetical protein
MGGLSKKAFQIQKISSEQHKPHLFVDSGNLLFKRPQIPQGPSPEQLTAEGIIKAYSAMQVDAVAVGPFDLAGGIALLQTSKKQGFPWLSANLLDQKSRPLFQPVRIKKIGKIKAGIIGLTGTVSALPAGITVADWRTVLPALIKKTAGRCDILILLSSLSPADNQEIAQKFPAIHLILTASLDSGNRNPQQINNTLITQTDRQGKYQGILTLDWNKSGRWATAKETELIGLRNRLNALDQQIQRMRQQTNPQQPDHTANITMAEKEKQTVEQQIKTLATDSANGKPEPCSFSHTFMALQQSLPETPEIKAIITEIKRQINTPRQTTSTTVPPSLLGHDGCKNCHPAQTKFWQTTRHAGAYQTLQKQNQALNPECLPCHVTAGPGRPLHRDQLLSLPPGLQEVGCENCHIGTGRSHADNPKQSQMTRQVAAPICLSCHTKEHDKHFDYQKMRKIISCPANHE